MVLTAMCAETTITGFSTQTAHLDTYVLCLKSHTSSVTKTKEVIHELVVAKNST